MSNKKLAEELQKPNLNNFKKRKAHSSFIDKILDFWSFWYAINKKFNKRIWFLLWVLDFFSRNTHWSFLIESNRHLNKIWVDKGSEFYNRSVKSWIEKKLT